jgi:Flp pilus assembly protein CpaB
MTIPSPATTAQMTNGEARRSWPPTPADTPAVSSDDKEMLPTASRSRWWLAGVAATVTFACAAIAATAVERAGHTVNVLVVTEFVPAGQPLAAADLRVAHLGGDGLSAVPATAQSRVLGRFAAVALLPGTLLTGGMLAPLDSPPSALLLVTVPLKPGTIPHGLHAGDTVDVLQVADATNAAVTSALLTNNATVWAVNTDPTSGTTSVSLLVPAAAAGSISSAGDNQTVALAVRSLVP